MPCRPRRRAGRHERRRRRLRARYVDASRGMMKLETAESATMNPEADDTVEQLRSIYRAYAPQKLEAGAVDELLVTYRGREETLLRLARAKYEPRGTASGTPTRPMITPGSQAVAHTFDSPAPGKGARLTEVPAPAPAAAAAAASPAALAETLKQVRIGFSDMDGLATEPATVQEVVEEGGQPLPQHGTAELPTTTVELRQPGSLGLALATHTGREVIIESMKPQSPVRHVRVGMHLVSVDGELVRDLNFAAARECGVAGVASAAGFTIAAGNMIFIITRRKVVHVRVCAPRACVCTQSRRLSSRHLRAQAPRR
jgi:hypothetical protein